MSSANIDRTQRGAPVRRDGADALGRVREPLTDLELLALLLDLGEACGELGLLLVELGRGRVELGALRLELGDLRGRAGRLGLGDRPVELLGLLLELAAGGVELGLAGVQLGARALDLGGAVGELLGLGGEPVLRGERVDHVAHPVDAAQLVQQPADRGALVGGEGRAVLGGEDDGPGHAGQVGERGGQLVGDLLGRGAGDREARGQGAASHEVGGDGRDEGHGPRHHHADGVAGRDRAESVQQLCHGALGSGIWSVVVSSVVLRCRGAVEVAVPDVGDEPVEQLAPGGPRAPACPRRPPSALQCW